MTATRFVSWAAEAGALKIVLCGSLITQMEELLAEDNPLYGRKTLAREILPMSLREAAEFVPQWEPADAITLQEEPEFLLRSELNEPRRYASIASAIADGATKPSEIVSRVHGLTGASEVSTYIDRLQQMRLIARERSLDADERSRNTRYSLQDPLFRFSYRAAQPWCSRPQVRR